MHDPGCHLLSVVKNGSRRKINDFGVGKKPALVADSRWIAFDAPKSGNSHIFVISSDGGPPRLLTQGAANDARPSWSNDGKWIYFGSNRTGEWQVWKAPAQGGDAVQVTKGGGREAFESVDGKLLFYSRYQKPGIWSVPAEGGEEAQVLEKAGEGSWGWRGTAFASSTRKASTSAWVSSSGNGFSSPPFPLPRAGSLSCSPATPVSRRITPVDRLPEAVEKEDHEAVDE